MVADFQSLPDSELSPLSRIQDSKRESQDFAVEPEELSTSEAASPDSHRRLRASLENMRQTLETGPPDSSASEIFQTILAEMEAILQRRPRVSEEEARS